MVGLISVNSDHKSVLIVAWRLRRHSCPARIPVDCQEDLPAVQPVLLPPGRHPLSIN